MKIIPFPLSLNIGSDIVHLPRISRLLAGRHADRFIRRILLDQEMDDFRRRFHQCRGDVEKMDTNMNDNSYHHNGFHHHYYHRPLLLLSNPNFNFNHPGEVEVNISRWIAGRFAAKEAARKAAPKGAGSLGWKDVLVSVEGEDYGGGGGGDYHDEHDHNYDPSHSQTLSSSSSSSSSSPANPPKSSTQRPQVLYLRGYKEHEGGWQGMVSKRRKRGGMMMMMMHDGEDEGVNEKRDMDDQTGIFPSSSENDGIVTVGRVGKLTISHDGEYVMATVIAADDD